MLQRPAEFESLIPELEKIYRFDMFDVFRFNVYQHELRVAAIVKDMKPAIVKTLAQADFKKIYTLAFIHDDAETITGDIQFSNKTFMTKSQLKKIDNDEEQAVKALVKKFPKKINGYSYEELLNSAIHKNTLEAQIVSYADKIDASCEATHELFSGNLLALRPVTDYERALTEFKLKYPKIIAFLNYKKSPWTNLGDRTDKAAIRSRYYNHLFKPHTKTSIRKISDFPRYNRWREITLKNFPDGEKMLTIPSH